MHEWHINNTLKLDPTIDQIFWSDVNTRQIMIAFVDGDEIVIDLAAWQNKDGE